MEKVHALAEGLGVSAIDVFRAASGEAVQYEYSDPWPSKTLLAAMDKIVDDRDLSEILKTLLNKPDKIKAVKKTLAIK